MHGLKGETEDMMDLFSTMQVREYFPFSQDESSHNAEPSAVHFFTSSLTEATHPAIGEDLRSTDTASQQRGEGGRGTGNIQ